MELSVSLLLQSCEWRCIHSFGKVVILSRVDCQSRSISKVTTKTVAEYMENAHTEPWFQSSKHLR